MKKVSIAATLEIPDHWDALSVRQFLQRTIITSGVEDKSVRIAMHECDCMTPFAVVVAHTEECKA